VRLVAAYPSVVTGESDRTGRPVFVLHEHRKPRHHFDLRLEENGVLRSWAVPRGLPVDAGHNRLAVAVPDHALDHLTYHDADKSIADTGWWEEHDRNERRIVFTLHGRRGSHRYALIRTDRDWLLHLTNDQP
jgi:DNA ligase D-like protein (predicted 3'-phosphoesterase)